jgi:vacuolar-type H+-ATPase subunit H
MEALKDLIPLLSNGGVAMIMFAVWYFTFTRSNRLFEQAMQYADKRTQDAIEHANRRFSEVVSNYEKLTEELLQIQREDVRTREMLAGVLSRLEKAVEGMKR